MSEPAFDPTPRPALQPRPQPPVTAPVEHVPNESAPADSIPVAPEPETSEPATPEQSPVTVPPVRVKVTSKANKKQRKVDGKRFGRGSTADTQLAPKAKRVKVVVRLPKPLRTELADEAGELGISIDDYITNILRSR